MRKRVNFRVSLFVAVGLIIGVFSFYEYLFGDFYFGLFSVVALVVCAVLFALLKSKAYRVFALTLVFVIAGFGFAQLHYNRLTLDERLGETVTLSGRVAYYCDGQDGFYQFYMEDCADENGARLKGRVSVKAFYDEAIAVGDNVTVTGEAYSVYPVQSQVKTYFLRSGVRYELDSASVVSVSQGRMNVGESIRSYICRTAQDYMPLCSDIAYSLLTGDRSYLPADVNYYFTQAGIIHLLAVSGLHVGFIVAILCFALRRLRLRPVIEWALVCAPLVFYGYICNFAPSVTRAIIMVCCGYAAKIARGRYDLLTSLSWAAAIILTFSPFSLFDAGFQLSALSVFGIATLYPRISGFLRRRRMPNLIRRILNSLALSASCSLSTLFTVAVNFGRIPTLGVLVNLIAIPLVSFAFVLCFVGLLPWVFHYVLYAADMTLLGVYSLAEAVGELPFASVSMTAVALSVVVAAIWCFVAGGYVNLNRIGRAVTHALCFVAIAVCVGAAFIRYAPTNRAYVCYGYGDCMVTVTSSDGEMVIVGDFADRYAAAETLSYAVKYKVNTCVLYFSHYQSCESDVLQTFLNALPIDRAYALDFSPNGNADELLQEKGVTLVRQAKNSVTGGSVTARSLYDGGLVGVVVSCGQTDVAILYGDTATVSNTARLVNYADVYALADAKFVETDWETTALTRYQTSNTYNYGANKYGNFTIAQKGDTITLKFR